MRTKGSSNSQSTPARDSHGRFTSKSSSSQSTSNSHRGRPAKEESRGRSSK